MRKELTQLIFMIGISALCLECSKNTIIVSENTPPSINNVPSIKIENYVNRIFIDLIGREPLDQEMDEAVEALRTNELSIESRLTLIEQLQNSEIKIEGDTSYKRAYFRQLYIKAKIHLLEGAADATIRGFSGDEGEAAARLKAVVEGRQELEEGIITINELFGRMVHNAVYDQINMNSFNFVNATFDNLFWRFPTNEEFRAGFDMVDSNTPATLLGKSGQSKADYVHILSNSREIFEGLIIWVYQQLLARRPTTEETATLLLDFIDSKDIRKVEQAVMITNEYANF